MRRSGIAGLGLAVVLLLVASMALAATSREMRKQVQASMLVTGRVIIETDGRVAEWTIDQRERLPEGVARLVDQTVPGWRFDPVVVDGQAVRGDARMSLRVFARRADNDSGNYLISIEDGYFGLDALSWEERREKGVEARFVRSARMDPPRYPPQALERHASGTVYLVVQVGPEGKVLDVVVEQVNLRTLGSKAALENMRKMLARPALEAARDWTFLPPAPTGEDPGPWTVRVPVDFRLDGARPAGYGQWDAYVPGPRHPVPWRRPQDDAGASPDTMVAGEVYQDGAALTLRSPVGG